VEHLDDVGARARLHGGGDAGLQVVSVDELEHHLSAQGLAGVDRLALQFHVAGGDEVHPADDIEPRTLGVGRGAARGQDAFQPGRRGGAHRGGPGQERAAADG